MTREEFITLTEGTQKEFRRFLTALCSGDSQLADDIAQESYVKAYLSADGLRDTNKFKSWLYRIGYTTILNSKRTSQIQVGYNEAGHVATKENADATFRYQDLYASLERLPAKERTSVLLFYMEGYSVKEIAAITDSQEAAVKKQLSRGRNHLKELLSKYENKK